ncbi:mannose-1-phosphate guanylyltransferase/mannose-6-phosphate isomerase [Bdellovibrio sp. HCB185ZH]|uniref:mannose-1-phosphate guanylyltransferase/mannose-6-phosphate isomerase n=1 Tax=Bdellovibrio sp. HCB185ZH TaxID=3394235 RepID=UPI0039A4BA51
MIPVVLSGGSGTRLWPISRAKLPKQFCTIFEQSLHAMTLTRLCKLGEPWVITSQALRDLTIRNLNELSLNPQNLILEPFAKNTAPAIALLTALLLNKGRGEEVVGIFPADHVIENEEVFNASIHFAKEKAVQGKVVTLGISPDSPATGYGYIQSSLEHTDEQGTLRTHSVIKFHEKPSKDRAEQFLQSGGYYWNAGIFVFQVRIMADLFKSLQPEMWALVNSIRDDFSNIVEIYNKVENISIDYAIMEKLFQNHLACIPCDIGWNDVGSWDAIADVLGGTQTPQKIEVRSNNNFVQALEGKTYAFVDVDDLVVVDSGDALLISKRGRTQGVKDVVDLLKLKNPGVLKDHLYEDRPWGRYEVLRDADNFKSKVIQVNPSQQLSYQSHKKREEHWIVTKGQGEVVLNDETFQVQAGSYIKIPLGAKHRIRNSGTSIIEFVEVQMGSYFGEDDIVRYQDDYSRI